MLSLCCLHRTTGNLQFGARTLTLLYILILILPESLHAFPNFSGTGSNPYHQQPTWKLWAEDQTPVNYGGTTYSLPVASSSRLYPNLANSVPWPGQFLATTTTIGEFSGWWDDGYKSEDNEHTMSRTSWSSGSASINLGNGIINQFLRLNIGDFGANSWSNKALGINFTSQSTTCMGHNLVQGWEIQNNEREYYFASTLRSGPSYYSFRDHRPDRTIDSFEALPVIGFPSHGRSGSEVGGMFKMQLAGGYLPRTTKNLLKRKGTYPSTLLYIYKASLPYANADGTPVSYDNELRHRAGYLSNGGDFNRGSTGDSEFMKYNRFYHRYDEGLHLYEMTQLASSMSIAPPIAAMQFVQGARTVNGQRTTFNTNWDAGHKIVKSPLNAGETVELTVDVSKSFDLAGRTLTPKWTVLYPEQKNVTIRHDGGTIYTIIAQHDPALPKGRIPVLFTVNNGVYDSNPAVVSFFPTNAAGCQSYQLGSTPNNEVNVNQRPIFTTSANGTLPVVVGTNAQFTLSCTDPEGFPTKIYRWLGERGTLSGNNFTLTTTQDDLGKNIYVRFICSDGTGGYNSLEQIITVNNTASMPPNITVPTVTQPTCAAPIGKIVVNATTSNGEIEYSTNNGSTWQTSNIFNLSHGSYNIKTRLKNDPTSISEYEYRPEINQHGNPVALNHSVPAVITSIAVTQPSSCSASTGTIVVNATGSGTLNYSKDNGTTWQSSNTFSGLVPGSYSIKVRRTADATCDIGYTSNPVVINPPPAAPTIFAVTATQPTITTPSGSIIITATGSGTLQYSINNGTNWSGSNTFLGLVAGTYNVRVRQASDTACDTPYQHNPVIINATPAPPPTITAPTVTQPTCSLSTGTIVVNATGTSTLEYSINNGSTWQLSNTFSGLSAGNYNIRVRLQSDPTNLAIYTSNPVVISPAPSAPTISAPTVIQPSCSSPIGTIAVNATANGAMQYSIDNGTTWQSSHVFSGLTAASYIIRVRLAENTSCTRTYSANPVLINAAPAAPAIAAVSVIQPTESDPSGSIITASGSDDLQYSVDNGANWQESNIFLGLAVGTYNVMARLANNPACQVSHRDNPVSINALPTPTPSPTPIPPEEKEDYCTNPIKFTSGKINAVLGKRGSYKITEENILNLFGNALVGFTVEDQNFNIEQGTVLKITFASNQNNPNINIGFSNKVVIDQSLMFQVAGGKRFGLPGYHSGYPSDGAVGEEQQIVVPVGLYYTGSFSHLLFLTKDSPRNDITDAQFKVQICKEVLSENTEPLECRLKVKCDRKNNLCRANILANDPLAAAGQGHLRVRQLDVFNLSGDSQLNVPWNLVRHNDKLLRVMFRIPKDLPKRAVHLSAKLEGQCDLASSRIKYMPLVIENSGFSTTH